MACEEIIQDGSQCHPFIKDPNSVLDYKVDWSEWLGTDTISSFTVIATDISIDSSSNTTTDITIWVSGGTLYKVATVLLRIVTAAGRQEDRTVYFKIQEK